MVATALQPNIPRTSSASNTTGRAHASQPSTLAAQGSQPTAAEGQRISDLQEQFQQQAQKDPAGFRLALRTAFGDKASLAEIDQLLDLALSGKLPMPSSIQLVEAGSLGSVALGAYNASNGGSLYLDRSLLSDPEKLQSVFNEEMGHHLDALLGGSDADGDEGAVFSRTLEEGALGDQELSALKSEDDHGVVQIEGRWVQVEFSEEGGDNSGSESSDGGESGGSGTEAGGGECSADSGSGSTGAESAGDNGNDSDSDDTGGECSVDSNNEDRGTPGTDGPGKQDGRDENKGGLENGNSKPDMADGKEVPSEEDTETDLTALGNAGTSVGIVEALNQKAVEGLSDVEIPDEIKGLNRTVAAGMKAVGYALAGMDPLVAAEHARQRAESEGADVAEQVDQAARAGVQRLDNVGVTLLGAAMGSPSGAGAVIGGVVAGNAYGGSAADEAFDSAVDTLADEAQSPSTNAQGYINYGSTGPMTLDQGWANFGRLR